MAPARLRSTIRRALTILVTAAIAIAGTGTHAHAQPSIPELEGQISEAWNQLEPLIEHYNLVHSQLQQNRAKATKLQQQMQPLQLRVELELTRVSVISVALYMRGPASQLSAMLASGNPEMLVDQMSTLDELAHQQNLTVQDAADLVAQYQKQKQPLDQLIATEAQQDADLAAKKKVIETKLANLQKLRQQAYGASGMAGGSLRPVACPFVLTSGKGAVAAKAACNKIGKPYVWATAGPSTFDCSGLTLYAWKAAGVSLGHYTGWQWNEATKITRSQLQVGDLVFFFSDHHHVGIYMGGGWMVHAPSTGDVVRMAKIDSPYLPIAGYRHPR